MTQSWRPAWRKILDGTRGSHERLLSASQDCQGTQALVLKEILYASSKTDFGRTHDFASIRNYSEFAQRVPVQDYESLSPWIKRIEGGERDVLFPQAPVIFERTGGSTSGEKIIPYTARSTTAFQDAVFPWIQDLLTEIPKITEGRCYWALSPATRASERTSSGTPIGAPDAYYFGEELDLLPILAVPGEVGAIQDLDLWRQATLEHLIKAEDLSLISVWSPTFFLELLEWLPDHLPKLDLQAHSHARVVAALKSGDFNLLWPALQLISCWSDGPSSFFASELARKFPGVRMQGKGLLATESAVSIPLLGTEAPLLALLSAFFEFASPTGEIIQPHAATLGTSYRVLVSGFSGLYRYDLGDSVQVVGWRGSTPLIRFQGRDQTSDLCGEKLSESFVIRCLERILPGRFAMLVARQQPQRGYVLVTDQPTDSRDLESIRFKMESELCLNPQYAYALKLGQLAPLQAKSIPQARTQYLESERARGRKLGTIKMSALLSIAPSWL